MTAAHADEPPTKVLYVGFENMTRAKAFADMPYLQQLAGTYGEATQVSNPLDPSLPNYLAQTFGNDFGITDDANPAHHPLPGQTVYGNAVANGRTAHVYAQDMVGNCELFNDVNGYYKVRHAGGLPYAVDELALCEQIMTPMETTFWPDVDAGALPNVGWLAPSNRNNAHRPSTPDMADAWLQQVLPRIMAGPDYQSGQLVIVISTDEGNDNDHIVPFVVVHPALAGISVDTPLTEADLYRAFLRYGGSVTTGPDDLTVFGL
ncbi:MAG: alkaline phosphatase family protein [Actinomycetota bacterium]|nr:alkaline phosphatase family protein [Actinomycetota bacterium]